MRTSFTQIIPAAIVGVIVGKCAVRSVIEMETKSTAVTCIVIPDREVFAVITQDAVHLVLQVIVVDLGMADFMEENGSPISIRDRFPDIQEESVRWDFGG